MGDEASHHTELAQRFRVILNSHGHGFQYSVAARIQAFRNPGHSLLEPKFRVTATELPIIVHGGSPKVAHIDIVARDRWRLLVVECKRANPAYADWCFVETPGLPGIPNQVATHDGITGSEHGAPQLDMRRRNWNDGQLANLAFEVKTKEKGDACPGGGVDDAIAQVFRGTAGMVDLLCGPNGASRRPNVAVAGDNLELIPVIVTTANLFLSEERLDEAALTSGSLDGAQPQRMKPMPWLVLHYPCSPNLRPSTPLSQTLPRPPSDDRGQVIGSVLDWWYRRTVYIVSAEGLDKFLAAI